MTQSCHFVPALALLRNPHRLPWSVEKPSDHQSEVGYLERRVGVEPTMTSFAGWRLTPLATGARLAAKNKTAHDHESWAASGNCSRLFNNQASVSLRTHNPATTRTTASSGQINVVGVRPGKHAFKSQLDNKPAMNETALQKVDEGNRKKIPFLQATGTGQAPRSQQLTSLFNGADNLGPVQN